MRIGVAELWSISRDIGILVVDRNAIDLIQAANQSRHVLLNNFKVEAGAGINTQIEVVASVFELSHVSIALQQALWVAVANHPAFIGNVERPVCSGWY